MKECDIQNAPPGEDRKKQVIYNYLTRIAGINTVAEKK